MAGRPAGTIVTPLHKQSPADLDYLLRWRGGYVDYVLALGNINNMPPEPSPTTQSLRSAIDSLRESLRLRQVIPIVGPDLLSVRATQSDGSHREVLFYRLVAETLLAQYGLPTDVLESPNTMWDLHRATAAILARSGTSTARLRRSVSSTIRELEQKAQPAGALAALAGLTCFDLFVCLTPDELLRRALAEQQPGVTIAVNSYAPRADSSQTVDIPPSATGRIRLYHPLGRAEAAIEFAVHEEDALEYFHRFHGESERRAKNLLTELHKKDRLFLGCGLPDWMGRGLMRLVNDQRLSSSERTMEFFCAPVRDAALTGFLDRFSPNSIIFPWEAGEFVEELGTLMGDVKVSADPKPRPRPTPTASDKRQPSAFVSYASQDAAAARRIAESLVQTGFGVVWLDQKVLITGDDWSSRIDDAIDSCDFFVPVLSQQADQRREGVFWEEWRKAVRRSMRINDAFLLPVGIDEHPPGSMPYERIFSGITKVFRGPHLLHAPDGQLSADGRDQLARRVQGFLGERDD
jgi:hypothetical protein